MKRIFTAGIQQALVSGILICAFCTSAFGLPLEPNTHYGVMFGFGAFLIPEQVPEEAGLPPLYMQYSTSAVGSTLATGDLSTMTITYQRASGGFFDVRENPDGSRTILERVGIITSVDGEVTFTNGELFSFPDGTPGLPDNSQGVAFARRQNRPVSGPENVMHGLRLRGVLFDQRVDGFATLEGTPLEAEDLLPGVPDSSTAYLTQDAIISSFISRTPSLFRLRGITYRIEGMMLSGIGVPVDQRPDTEVPEPMSLILLGSGLLGFCAKRRRTCDV